jgi:hypothetical protein
MGSMVKNVNKAEYPIPVIDVQIVMIPPIITYGNFQEILNFGLFEWSVSFRSLVLV